MNFGLKLVIFDYDGLMVNSEYVVYDALKTFYKKHGHDLPWSYYCKHIGMPVQDALVHFYKDFPIALSFDKFFEERNKIVAKYIKKKLALMPHLKELLDIFAKRNISMAIATSGKKNYISYGLNKFGINKYFETIVTVDEVKRGKPHPDLILETLRRTGFAPSKAIIIEDSPHGIESARRAKIRSIAIPTRGVALNKFEGASIVCESLGEVEGKLFN
jgi:HAD superfamily hydrolase (TIGR01509 family)